MLVRFGVDSKAFVFPSEQGEDWQTMRAAHDELLDFWKLCGLLVTSKEGGYFSSALKDLPQCVRLQWMNLRKKFRDSEVQNGRKRLEEVRRPEDFSSLSEIMDLALFGYERCKELGVPEDKYSCEHAEVEVASFLHNHRSNSIRKAKTRCSGDITDAHKTEYIWENWFKSLVSVHRKVVIVDRYAARNCHENKESGLKTLIEKMAEDGRLGVLRIFSSDDNKAAALEICQSLDRKIRNLPWKNDLDVEIIIARDDAMRHLAHHRYVRFDERVLRLDVGIEVLNPPKPSRANNTYSFVVKSDEVDLENKLRSEDRVLCKNTFTI